MNVNIPKILLVSIVMFLLISCETSSTYEALPSNETPTARPADKLPDPTLTPADPTPVLTSTPEYPGSTQTRFQDTALMMEIPGGKFIMGSESRYKNEHPVHEVSLETFWMDQIEVTNSMYAEFLNANGNQVEDGFSWFDAENPKRQIQLVDNTWQVVDDKSDHPVVDVNWYGARAYCEWVGARLPTEAEWEYAARGGLDEKLYPWGDKKPVCEAEASNGANYFSCGEGGTKSVRSFAANGYGLYDMSGNVMEWVEDWYAIYPGGESENPLLAGKYEQFKVLRGGAWGDAGNIIRVAFRFQTVPSYSNHFIGFRCTQSTK